MATPNYSYEKRQRELAKKRKKEEKLQKKSTRQDDGNSGVSPQEATENSNTAAPDQLSNN